VSREFIPHGHCYLWQPGLVRLHVLSDSLIALAYYSILVMLVYFVRTRRDVPYAGMFLLFGTFIVACGTTHVMEVWTLWHPIYWLSGLIKAITAFVSVFTALEMVSLLPKALTLPNPAQLEATNVDLLNEVVEHKRTEKVLYKVLDELEIRVQQRTAELIRINESLEEEITERKRIEEALRESEQRARGTFNQAAVGIAHMAIDGLWLLVNQRLCDIVGYTQEELRSQTFQDTTHPDDLDTNLKYVDQILADDIQTYSMETRYFRKDGAIVWINLTLSLAREPSGEPKYFIAVIEDISKRQAALRERKRMEEALRESEQRFRLMADTVPVMIWESGTDKLCNYFNKVWLEFTGRTIEQEKGDGWAFGVHPEDKELYLDTYTNAFDARQKFKMEYRLKRFDDEYRWILDTGIPQFTLDGSFAGYIGSCVDITDRKQAEEQIEASLLEKEVLLKEIYHRVKNNLQVISSLLNLQSEYIKDKQDLEIFKESQQRIGSMALIHEKLYQSKDLAMINFGEYVQDLVASLFSTYEVNTDALALTINIDNILLGLDAAIPCALIINELVSNSLKYAFPAGKTGEIHIIADTNDDLFTLNVSDNGIGLPPDFDFKNTSTLGLQLVDILTNQLSGNIKITCNQGVKFKIKFPALIKK